MNKRILSVGIFTALYLGISTPVSILRGNDEFLFYISVVILLGIIVLLVDRRVTFSAGVLWALSVWGLLHMLGGLVPVPESWPVGSEFHVLYSLWLIPNYLKYDHIIHAYGFAVATWVCWQALRSAVPKIKPSFGILTLCALGGMGLGSVNEIIEFMAVLAIPGTNVGGYINTGWDLVANFLGSTFTAVVIGLNPGQKR